MLSLQIDLIPESFIILIYEVALTILVEVIIILQLVVKLTIIIKE
jgi:hypothetical protein